MRKNNYKWMTANEFKKALEHTPALRGDKINYEYIINCLSLLSHYDDMEAQRKGNRECLVDMYEKESDELYKILVNRGYYDRIK